jgi:1D-myo-inositol-tetrakisphosphate 5-kinase/inositol-polyphosphate multikinase
MDDMAFGLKNPAVIDFKIGRITHDPEASQEKIQRQKSKYPPVECLGFQLLGMRVFDKKYQSFSHYDKVFGRSLNEDDVIHGLALYFQFHQTPQLRAIQETLRRFEEIREWFKKQKSYHFFSSSLIVVYDANLEDHDDNNNTSNQTNHSNGGLCWPSVRVAMADFAHVFPSNNTLDENYLFGLERLIEHLKLLLSPEYKFKEIRSKNID